MAINFDQGVILGADSRTTTGAYIANRVTDKLTQVHDTIWCCRSGSAADTQAVADIVHYHLGMYGITNDEPPTTQTAAALFQELCYDNKDQLSAGMIIAGYDPRHGGSVYSIPLGGSLHQQPYAIGGSGSTYIYGYCDSYWKDGMTEAEGIEFVKGALREAIKWDGSSGGVIRLVVLSKTGAVRHLYLPDQGAANDSVRRLTWRTEAFEDEEDRIDIRPAAAVPGRTIIAKAIAKFTSIEAASADMSTVTTRTTLSDIAPFLHNMVIGDAYQTSSTRSGSSHNLATLSHASRLPNAPSTRARHPSTSATPTPTATPWSTTTRPRSSSHAATPTASIAIPPARDGAPNGREDPTPYDAPHPGESESESDTGYDPRGLPRVGTPRGRVATPPSPRLQPQNRSVLSFNGSGAPSPSRIKVRDLNHIQSFASEEVLTRSRGSRHSLRSRQDGGQQYEISSMPVADIIEMVAGLLTKITTTNDRQDEHLHRHLPPSDSTAGLSQQATSVLAFHGKNVPSITILSYLSRIHKYCPTTYEVFLSLLVYFDRMTEMVNNGALQSHLDDDRSHRGVGGPSRRSSTATTETSPTSSPSPEVAADKEQGMSSSIPAGLPLDSDAYNLSHFFVVDSFNIHRLVIAGVTCASKFFSDVFYTNSRYAKVGGLPLIELNHLELQFLLLNDFRLSVPVEELEAYGTMLVEFYAREVMSQQGNPSHSHLTEGLYMQSAPP
ncbi:Proteasome subunit beta type-1 [Pseudocyphellaria aurata]|nr:Proteasome subunit beta type-1 [Pseudocyphellaria aurata]